MKMKIVYCLFLELIFENEIYMTMILMKLKTFRNDFITKEPESKTNEVFWSIFLKRDFISSFIVFKIF